jgi:hypothetical protein
MRKIVLLLLMLSFLSCSKHSSSKEFLLTGGHCKFWDVIYLPHFYNKKQSKIYPLYCFSFDKDHKWFFYSYDKGVRTLYDNGDIEIPEIWDLKLDNSFALGLKKYKLIKLTNDTLIYAHNKADSVVLTRSKY